MPRINYKNEAGKRLQGVTTITGQIGWGKGGLMYWANQQGLEGRTLNDARDTATVPGTIAHYLIECELTWTKPKMEPEWSEVDIAKANKAFNNYKKWCQTFGFVQEAVEPNLVSEKYQFGGTPDVIAQVQGKRCIVDWKTGKIYESTLLQLAAYKILWEENHPDKLIDDGFHLLRIPRNLDNPTFHHSHWEQLPPEAEEAFHLALQLRDIEKALKTHM